MTPIAIAIERALRYLDRLDVEREKVVAHVAALRRLEFDSVNVLPRFPGRALKAELREIKRVMRKERQSA
jgi:hypothetical protein